MSEERKTPPRGDKPDGENDSEITHEHRALMNQGSARPEDYPEEKRAAQSLVDPAEKEGNKRREKPG